MLLVCASACCDHPIDHIYLELIGSLGLTSISGKLWKQTGSYSFYYHPMSLKRVRSFGFNKTFLATIGTVSIPLCHYQGL